MGKTMINTQLTVTNLLEIVPATNPLQSGKDWSEYHVAGFQIHFQGSVSIANSNGSVPTVSTKSPFIFYQFLGSSR